MPPCETAVSYSKSNLPHSSRFVLSLYLFLWGLYLIVNTVSPQEGPDAGYLYPKELGKPQYWASLIFDDETSGLRLFSGYEISVQWFFLDSANGFA